MDGKLDGENTRFLPGEESCKEASRRTGLNTITNNLRLELERRQESFRAKEKPRASFADLPGSGGQHFCFGLRLLLLRR